MRANSKVKHVLVRRERNRASLGRSYDRCPGSRPKPIGATQWIEVAPALILDRGQRLAEIGEHPIGRRPWAGMDVLLGDHRRASARVILRIVGWCGVAHPSGFGYAHECSAFAMRRFYNHVRTPHCGIEFCPWHDFCPPGHRKPRGFECGYFVDLAHALMDEACSRSGLSNLSRSSSMERLGLMAIIGVRNVVSTDAVDSTLTLMSFARASINVAAARKSSMASFFGKQ